MKKSTFTKRLLKVGDCVRTLDGDIGVIKDALIAFDFPGYYYLVQLENASTVRAFSEEELTIYTKSVISLSVEFEDNVLVVCVLKDGSCLARGHAHILHDGDLGLVQACSYAMKRAYESLGGNKRGYHHARD